MNDEKKLVLTFADANGKEFILSYNYISDDVQQTYITALISAIIANGSIFANVPVSCKSAVVYSTTATSYNVN